MSERRGWFFSFWHDYEPLYRRGEHKWSWIDFCLINIGGEWSNYVPRAEINLGLLGFHVCVEYWRHDPDRCNHEPGEDCPVHPMTEENQIPVDAETARRIDDMVEEARK